jgi:hypothetical protein
MTAGSDLPSAAVAGYVIPMGELQGYLNVKGYKDSTPCTAPTAGTPWLTFAISPAAPSPPPAPKPRITK